MVQAAQPPAQAKEEEQGRSPSTPAPPKVSLRANQGAAHKAAESSGAASSSSNPAAAQIPVKDCRLTEGPGGRQTADADLRMREQIDKQIANAAAIAESLASSGRGKDASKGSKQSGNRGQGQRGQSWSSSQRPRSSWWQQQQGWSQDDAWRNTDWRGQ